MKSLSCRDLGGDCDYVASGKTSEEVKKNLWAHAKKAHKSMLDAMTEKEKTNMQKRMDEVLKAR